MTPLLRILAPLLALALLCAGPARAEEGVSAFSLDNGLEVVVIEDHRAPAVVHMLWYRVGAADEPAGVSGVAHLLEHMMFKGTETHPPGAFSDFVEAHGGRDNAFTSWDFTGYFQRVAADLLPDMMAFEADRMANLVFEPEQTETELRVVLEERAQRVDSEPRSIFSEQARAAQYLNHPYARPIIGWPQEVAALTQADARAFYEAHYVPNNAVLVVAGDVTPGSVRAMAREHYGPIPADPDLAPRTRPQEPPQRAARRLDFADPRIAQPYLTRSYLAPERDAGAQETAAALELLSLLLAGDGATSYLGNRLQFEDEVALYVGGWYRGVALDDTTFNLTVAPAPGTSLAEAETALDAALADFMAEGVDAEQLARLKRQHRASIVYAMDDAQDRARRYGSALTSGLTVADVQAWPQIVQDVTGEDIMAAAREVLVPETSVTGFLRAPEAPAPEVSQ